MLTQRDLQALDQAATLIISVIERHRIHEEDSREKRSQIRFIEIPKNKNRGADNKSRRAMIEKVINLLALIMQYVEESNIELHGILGQMDAVEDFALIQRQKFVLYSGEKEEKAND